MTESDLSALVVDDDAGVRQTLRLCLEATGIRVLGVGTTKAALEALDRGRYELVLLDLWLGSESGLAAIPEILRRQPRTAIIVITAFATFESAVEAMKRGATDYLPKPFSPEQVRHAALRAVEGRRLKRDLAEARARLAEVGSSEDYLDTENGAYRVFLQQAARVAAADVPVLLRGESGTGKNVMARWLWQRSPRSDGPFASVNCPALTGDLMNSELFGHKRGAFTGAAADAPGKVQEAEGGTLFLDEVGDLSLDAQARLLRFLNDGSYQRVGDAKERRADARVLAATNRPLEDDVRAGRFREDLFFRLNVLALTVPPLRDRKEDLAALSQHYLTLAGHRQHRSGLGFSERSRRAIAAYAWPGNLREMRNAIERAVILSPELQIEPEDLGVPPPPLDTPPPPSTDAVHLGGDVSVEALEREHIARIIGRTPTLEAAARILCIDITTLQRKRKRYGLV